MPQSELENLTAIAAGGLHSMGLKQDGSIVAWGYNSSGQSNVPAPNSGFVAIAAGLDSSIAIRANVPQCAFADLNCDGVVNVSDLLLLLGEWGDCADCTPGTPGSGSCPADLNGDCTVNVSDLLLLLANWG